MSDANAVRSAFQQLARDFWVTRHHAHTQNQELSERFLAAYRLSRDPDDIEPSSEPQSESQSAPQSVKDASDYYGREVEAHDWGSVGVYRIQLVNQFVFIVMTTTDGDDGWVELYDVNGEELGVGRTYIELVSWGDRDTIRAQVQTGEFPPELSDRAERTLWSRLT